MKHGKPIIGLCGGIGAGKSRVAAEFGTYGCCVISSDELNHAVLRRPDVLATLQAWWGADVAAADGGPNRSRLAELIFDNPREKRRLEELVYPLIAEMREHKIRAVSEDQAVKAIILDSPLLFESDLVSLCDVVVFIEASRETRLRRLQRSRNWDEDQLRKREQWQHSLATKRARSDYVINNDGAPERLQPQVRDILDQVVSRFAV